MRKTKHSRRKLLVGIGAGATIGLAGCMDDAEDLADPEEEDEEDEEPEEDEPEVEESVAFSAELSDDPDIPGHGEAGSDGTGAVVFESEGDGTLDFTLSYEDLEGDVNGIHIHGDGAADGRYLVRLFETTDSDFSDIAIVTDEMLDAEGGEISGTIIDEDVNADGDYDDINSVDDLISELESLELGEHGGVVNIHTEHDPDSELAGSVVVA